MADGFLHNITHKDHSSIHSPLPHTVLCSATIIPYMYVHIAIFKNGRSHKFYDLCEVLMPYKNSPTKAKNLTK